MPYGHKRSNRESYSKSRLIRHINHKLQYKKSEDKIQNEKISMPLLWIFYI